MLSEDENEIVLISIYGVDQPGVTSQITGILGKYNAEILDIGQADIHQSLSLGILVRFRKSQTNVGGGVLKDILFKGYELGVKVRFVPISTEQYNEWVSKQGQDRHIVTILGKGITAEQISKITGTIAEQGLNIDSIKRLTGRMSLNSEDTTLRACIELSIRGTFKDRNEIQAKFMQLSATLGVDISFQKDDIYRRNRRLICFDMDSTLIKTEVIDELADRAGVGAEVRAITESAMRGEIDFQESFKRRISLLKGLDESVMQDIAEKLPIMDGADRLMTILKKCGYKIAILSGGFTYFGEYLKKRFGIDYVYANELEIKDGKLTGNYVGDIVDGHRKAELLKMIAQFEHIDLKQVIAVGDGANDLPMINLAGLGIAFHAKPKVKSIARQSISTIGLDGILYFLGFRDSHIDLKK
ncbi:MAG: phosphoserine phosphatase SerB [Bacteroidales bacterium]|jgi:phosphoserine phosphatase|nr:phosphoserine phosphatase SerB [Bacteroidales bacterium]MDD6357516.1 phosphoserine phosphatase SerB [Bacteroidales bacterium]